MKLLFSVYLQNFAANKHQSAKSWACSLPRSSACAGESPCRRWPAPPTGSSLAVDKLWASKHLSAKESFQRSLVRLNHSCYSPPVHRGKPLHHSWWSPWGSQRTWPYSRPPWAWRTVETFAGSASVDASTGWQREIYRFYSLSILRVMWPIMINVLSEKWSVNLDVLPSCCWSALVGRKGAGPLLFFIHKGNLGEHEKIMLHQHITCSIRHYYSWLKVEYKWPHTF